MNWHWSGVLSATCCCIANRMIWISCTSARPEQFEHILRRFGHDGFWDMGRKFGTLGAMRRREDGTEVKVEVTTYRSDTYDPDSRKPEVNYGDTLEGDLSRRDFTVNAMALRVPELEFVDPFGGANDLAKGVLRTPVDPRQSFDDDPLRMMRAVRFVAQLGFRIEPETAEALSDMVDRIEIVSAERVRDELVKLLLSDRPRAGIEALVDSGLADIVLPEIPALQLEIDEHHRHKDVFEHTMIVIERAVALETGSDGPVPAPDLTLRLAALLHDIGKPKTRRFEAGGKVSFHRHDAVGAKMTRKRLKARISTTTWSRTSASWSTCICASTATWRSRGRIPRSAATSRTLARCTSV